MGLFPHTPPRPEPQSRPWPSAAPQFPMFLSGNDLLRPGFANDRPSVIPLRSALGSLSRISPGQCVARPNPRIICSDDFSVMSKSHQIPCHRACQRIPAKVLELELWGSTSLCSTYLLPVADPCRQCWQDAPTVADPMASTRPGQRVKLPSTAH